MQASTHKSQCVEMGARRRTFEGGEGRAGDDKRSTNPKQLLEVGLSKLRQVLPGDVLLLQHTCDLRAMLAQGFGPLQKLIVASITC